MFKSILENLKNKKLLVVILLLFFAVNFYAVFNTFTEKTTSSVWDGSISKKFKSGNGSVDTPYVINSGGELALFFSLINDEDNTDYFNKYYVVTNNIDLNGHDFSFAKFNKSFSGNFDGGGYTIFNFKISKYALDADSDTAHFTLFDSLYLANIRNINFSNITFVVDGKGIINDRPKEEKTLETSGLLKKYDIKFVNEDETSEEEGNSDTTTNENETTTQTPNDSENESTTQTPETNTTENITETTTEEMPNTTPSDDDKTVETTKEENKEEQTISEEQSQEENKTEQTTTEEQTTEEENKEEVKANEDVVVNDVYVSLITVSLFRDVKESRITNISVNDINIEYNYDEKRIDSSLFILNDVEKNTVENININGTSDVKSTSMLIKHYDSASIKNIIYNTNESGMELIDNYEIKPDDAVFEYEVKDGKLTFYENYAIKGIIEIFDNNAALRWKLTNNKFKIINSGQNSTPKKAVKTRRSVPSGHASGTDNGIVYVNDYESDAAYYQGLNYTYSPDGHIPTTQNKNVYNENNLVYVQIHYHGSDINNQFTGAVSNSESETDYIYYKVYPVNGNEVTFELIDNPYSKRPAINNNTTTRTFNGWITDYAGAVISLDTDIYVRSITIPVTYTNNIPDNISIDVYAVWNLGKVVNYSSSWSNTFTSLLASGFHEISSNTTQYESITPYYTRGTTYNGYGFPNNSVDYYGNSLSGTRCQTNGGCYHYVHASGNYNQNTQYYRLTDHMEPYSIQQIVTYNTEVPVGQSIAGYYRVKRIPNGGSLVGYYNTNGSIIKSGTCNTSAGCDRYELIQYYDENDEVEVVVENTIYYYFTTRDTNVIVLNSNVSSVWSQTKPFTLTALNAQNNYINSTYLGVNGRTYYCYADTRIENIRLQSNVSPQNNANQATGTAALIGNNWNLKIGRNTTTNQSNRVTWRYVIGSNDDGASSMTNYRMIIESGIYNNLGVSTRIYDGWGTAPNYYIHGQGIFGNDYDRVTEADPETSSKLEVRYILAGSWGGRIRGNSVNDVILHTTVKSGRYGTDKYDCYAGVYVGGLASGEHHATRVAVIEGGWIYNLLGGPLSQSASATYNETQIYMKGGSVDIIVGGAGRTATYGNKIISVTGGQVNYSVFGGSNGVEGNDSDQKGTVDGDSFVYIGGNAIIGKASNVTNNTIESKSRVEAGSVFGIGNGRSGYNAIGTVNNSNVIIDGNATVRRNVYGGGNYGATGQNGTNKTYSTTIVVHGGEIQGSIYGGGNNNGAGATSNTTNISITMDAGTVSGSIYGGSRTKGTVYGSTSITVTGGTITTDIYGGGEGGYASSSDPGTFVNGNVDIVIGELNGVQNEPTINGSVYGGSAYGTVNATSTGADANSKHVNVTVNNGRVVTSVFGGAKGSSTYTPYVKGDITVDINGGNIGNVYGGFDAAGKPQGDVLVTIDGGSITNAFGGGNQTSIDATDIRLRGGSVGTLYGGSNQNGTVLTTDVTISGGQAGTVFGGNNEGGSCGATSITMSSGKVTTAMYGGGNLVDTDTTTISITGTTVVDGNASTIPNVYGGGNRAGADETNITINGNTAKIGTLYGGSNESGVVTESNITFTNGTATTVYGGNNAGGSTTDSYITVGGGNITTLYGGGNNATTGTTHVVVNNTASPITTTYGGGNSAACTTTNVTINGTGGTFGSVYGGGNSAGATTTNVTITGANTSITDVFGGSNTTGDVTTSNVTINNGTIATVYGGNNAGGSTSQTHVTVNSGTVTTAYGGGNVAQSGDTDVNINNGTVTTVFGGGNQATVTTTDVDIVNGTITTVYGGGNQAGATTTNVDIVGSANTITAVYGGGNQAGATTTNVNIGTSTASVNVTSVYGGSNQSGTVGTSNVDINKGTITAVYGGNNAGGTTGAAHVNIDDGTITNVYGGGNEAETTSTTVTVNAGTFTNIYGGGNEAGVTGNTDVDILGGTVTHNVYGGGNDGTVGGNTDILVHNTAVNGSAYAGGNGSTAVVSGNTTITVSGTSVIGTSSCTNPSTCSVFGSGNAAATGTELDNDSVATVKITGATVYGNVYGGANTSKVFGETIVNIGADVPTGTNVTRGDILIHGTVFGGGEANASGSTTYDFSFISVTQGVSVNVNGNGYNNFTVEGSFFGSGNASSSAGDSEITIKNYGTFANPKMNVSIQRANLVTIDNSAIVLQGATDRTNEWSDVLFSISRVDELDIKNNTSLFLENGANLLQEFKSLNADGTYATVNIGTNGGVTSRSTDNRLYMFAGKHLDIAKDQNATDMGDVYGMTFFGMYKYNTNNGTVNIGCYGEETNGDDVDWGKVFDNVTSYVAGYHKENHNIKVDGFYTNFPDEETQKYLVDYITPTPPTGPLYMWIIGAGVIEYEVDLNASRYSTLGTYELSLRDFTKPNTTFGINGFDYSELNTGVTLVERSQVPKIASNSTDADNVMGISMETSNSGWLNFGQTEFVTDPDNPIRGTSSYVGGNSSSAPTVLLYLHHSKNIATAGSMGKVKITMMSVRQINALDKETKRLIITLNLSRTLYDTISYEGSMTAGRRYEMFSSTSTNITSSSSISAYYALFATDENIYKTGYHRTLVSTFVFPLNTKITMIDLSGNTPEYYYKVLDAQDVADAQNEFNLVGEVSYDVSMFEAMGAENSGVYYNDVTKNAAYYNSSPEYCEEEFIFIIDFGDTQMNTDHLNNKLLLEMRNASDATIYSVLAPQHDNLTYNIYANKDAVIDMDGEISSNTIYNGETFTADIQIDYTQSTVGSTVIYDTHYFDSKLGIKISLINSEGNVVTGTTLLGLYYVIDEVRYDPNIDGTTRIKIADKVDSAEKWIIINTGTSAIATGNYKLRIESFGSPDGIYYGLNSSDMIEFNIRIINEIYGLNVETTPEEMIINKETGKNENKENSISYTISYNSGLNNPNIRFKLYRRNYNNIDDTTYSLVDAADYFDDTLVASTNEKEYIISSSPTSSFDVEFTTKDDLMSGTYKMEFRLYDNNSSIGTVEKYFIIK